ncbi:PGCB protein, partial [Jacana jacana]|nr:PGCB protein [Jacana jacana]
MASALRLLLLWAFAPTVVPEVFGPTDGTEDLKALRVSIPRQPALEAVLAGDITIPCLITYLGPQPTPGTSGRRAVLGTPRVKWTFISEGKEVEILVARGDRVKVNEGYRLRASLPIFHQRYTNASLLLTELRPNDTGIYRCDVQHGIEDGHDNMNGFPGVRNYGVVDPEDMYDVYCYAEDLPGACGATSPVLFTPHPRPQPSSPFCVPTNSPPEPLVEPPGLWGDARAGVQERSRRDGGAGMARRGRWHPWVPGCPQPSPSLPRREHPCLGVGLGTSHRLGDTSLSLPQPRSSTASVGARPGFSNAKSRVLVAGGRGGQARRARFGLAASEGSTSDGLRAISVSLGHLHAGVTPCQGQDPQRCRWPRGLAGSRCQCLTAILPLPFAEEEEEEGAAPGRDTASTSMESLGRGREPSQPPEPDGAASAQTLSVAPRAGAKGPTGGPSPAERDSPESGDHKSRGASTSVPTSEDAELSGEVAESPGVSPLPPAPPQPQEEGEEQSGALWVPSPTVPGEGSTFPTAEVTAVTPWHVEVPGSSSVPAAGGEESGPSPPGSDSEEEDDEDDAEEEEEEEEEHPAPSVATVEGFLAAIPGEPGGCIPNPCLNGGTCAGAGPRLACLCLPGYGGSTCERRESPMSRCHHSHVGWCPPPTSFFKGWSPAAASAPEPAAQETEMQGNQVSLSVLGDQYREYQWIGLNDRTIEGDFQWSDGSPLLYENWHPGQPDSYFLSGENCVVIVWHDGGQWSDVPCNYHLSYTCKMGLGKLPPSP